MTLVVILVFLGVFVVSTLLLLAGGGASKQTEQAIAKLDAALSSSKVHTQDLIVDLRKDEILSAIPWINRLLMRLEIAPRLRTLLYQSGVKWTAGALLLMSFACFMGIAYLVYLRTNVIILAFLLG